MPVKIRRGSVRKRSIYECYDEWLARNQDKGLSDGTLQTYKEQANLFLLYTGDIPIEEITETTVYDFRYWLKQNRNYNDVSTNTVFRTINIFLTFLNTEYGLEKFHLDYVKTLKKVKQIFSDDDIKRLLKQPDLDHCTYSELRDWVIINIVLNTGVRAGSIVNVKIEDINFREHTIVFRHMKNRQQQVFPLKKDVLKIIRLYLDCVQDELEDYLFINSQHKQ